MLERRLMLFPSFFSFTLRYGDSPADSPFLWNYMKEYVVRLADIFQGE